MQDLAIRDQMLTIDLLSAYLKHLGVEVRFNVLTKELEVNGKLDGYSRQNAANLLPTILSDMLRQEGAKGCMTSRVKEFLACIADAAQFNPVRDYLHSLSWDGQDRLPGLYDALGIFGDTLSETYLRKWLIQCVALALNDEQNPVGAEGVLVLLGAQGAGKTSFFRKLVPEPRLFAEGVSLDMRDKDSRIGALNAWICELGELDSTTKKEQPALKAFLTATEDRIRPPYASEPVRSPRRTSFCGTVNDESFLRDATGNRRYWIIQTNDIQKDFIFSLTRQSIDQLWAQIFSLWAADHNGFRLSDSELSQVQQHNQQYEAVLPYETELRDLFDFSIPPAQWKWWKAGELSACGLLTIGRGDALKLGRALAKCAREFEANGYVRRAVKTVCKSNSYLLPIHFTPYP
ncbi:MAG: hypothetical protein KH319_01890 [Butyricicoccus pullicaecorum]|nr:hypothetical protein [Butyricicoccus pullicaecorum]